MRGKRFYAKLCLLIVAILCLGVVGGVCLTPSKISYVQAEDTLQYKHDKCSQKYDDGIIFSIEQVYFAKDTDRTTPLYLGTGKSNPISNILGYNNSNNYFLNYGGTNEDLSKRIINSGEYALLSETATRTAYDENNNQIALNQGIMLTLGGYVYDDKETETTNDDEISVNSAIKDILNPGTPDEKITYYSSKLQSINIEMKRNGKVFTETETTGKASLRTYNNGLYFDFVYFLDTTETNEGYYEINFTYTQDGGQSQTHSFNFYILLNSKYDNSVLVNGQEYSSTPTFSYTNTSTTTQHQSTVTGIDNQYPVLTYDYKHFDMKYSYTHNDLISNITVKYDENANLGEEKLIVETETNGNTVSAEYSCKEFSNDLVSFLFANVGTYEFEFNYVFYYDVDADGVNDRLVVENLAINNQRLDINGYELKYAKSGFASSDLRALSIVQNDTLIIPVNGYDNSKIESNENIELGYMYNFVAPETVEGGKKKSGEVAKLETADVTNKKDSFDEDASMFINVNDFNFADTSDFVDTDQGGLWLNLNDEYALTDSYFIYSPTKFINNQDYSSIKVNLHKVTTFIKTGYYFIKAGYKVGNVTNYQYFAFKISAGVANVKLYTTEENVIPEINENRLYSNQYTNKNVYATWDDPTTFASSQSATLYYTNQGYSNLYESKTTLLRYAQGNANVSLTSREYVKGSTLITNNGSYLLEVRVNGSDTKAYYYFTIDKEDIRGLEVLGISSASIGTSTIYNVARDSSNNPITYTSRVVIDKDFTFWWNDKNSGAQITGTYQYTPIIYSNINQDPIQFTENGKDYLWLVNNYSLGVSSNDISIEKPATKVSTVDPNNVLTNQGVYWFHLIDEAGNEMNYMVIVDKTEAVINATSKSGNTVLSGEMLAEDVTFEWGSHKAIQLSNDTTATGTVANKIYNQFYVNNSLKYYQETSSNATMVSEFLKTNQAGGFTGLYLVVENNKVVVENVSFGESVTINSGTTSSNSENIVINNSHNITIKLTDTEIVYNLKVFGDNQVENIDTSSQFVITLNPDKSEGAVKSKEDELVSLYTKVQSYNASYNEEVFNSRYHTGHASKDGLFVFEWANNEGTEYEVGKVYYDYYPLMTQEMLNKYNPLNSAYKYYPYDYSSPTRFTIYDAENNVNNYEIDADGIKTVYRSTTLNAGYVLYYDISGNLVSKNATLPGMYVITREYKNPVNDGTDSTIRNYVFFVDRNNIIDYSTTSISDKIVGENIDVLSQEEIAFTNFTQEVKNYTYGVDNYRIYLQTNRLPMEIRVPTGKYSSLVDGVIEKTSNSQSGKLNLKISFIDEYSLLGQGKIKFSLFSSTNFVYQDNGYITYSLTQDMLDYNISNMANIENYLKACNVTNSDWLSLPGVYLIELTDNVSIVFNDKANVNKMVIGVEITKSNPVVEMLANQIPSNENNADFANFNDELVFNTSKAYIRYELNEPDNTSFNAQVDNSYIYITQIENGNSRVYYDSSTNSGLINSGTQFFHNGTGYNYIQHIESDKKYVIWLDSGLEVVDGKIISYKEYTYKVYIRYILKDGRYTDCYIYNVTNVEGVKEEQQYCQSEITVNIDRTPYLENLETAVDGQVVFLEEYVKTYSDEDFTVSGNLDSNIYNTIAYRGPDGQDYYAVVNTLYYYYIDKNEYTNAENAMYAIRVGENNYVNFDGDIYYRKLYYSNNNTMSTESKDRRMALLPICEQYYSNVTGFATFSKTSWDGFSIVSSSQSKSWKNILNLVSNGYGYYEIIELDKSGNMTQYVVYVASTNTETGVEGDKTLDFVFEDVTYRYYVRFDFNGTPLVSVEADGISDLRDQFSLIPFNSVTDMFGLTANRDGLITDNVQKTKDWFYKINITNNSSDSYIYYLNYNNISLAEYLCDILESYNNQNYTINITDRYNQTLSLYVDVLSATYSLNIGNFNKHLKEDGNYYYICPDDLNSDLGNGGRYYVESVELTDLSDDEIPVYIFKLNYQGKIIGIADSTNDRVYSLDSEGKITKITDSYGNEYEITDDGKFAYLINADNMKEIKLTRGNEYQVRFIDCARKEYDPIIVYAYETTDETDAKVEAYGEYNTINNVFYSTNPVKVTYNSNVYTNIVIDVYKDGLYVGRYADGFNADNISVEMTEDGKNNILLFNPYSLVAGIKEEGALLRYELSLLFNNNADKKFTIVIDNRMPVISLINTSGEDKTNIMKVEYNYSKNYDDKVTLDSDELFDIVPTLTLSETVVLGWGNFDKSIYKNDIGSYYHPYLYLLEYKTRDDYTVINLTNNTNTVKNISPKEGALGRYVLILAFHKQEVEIREGNNVALINKGLISYKAYVFNISSTANAMYEVQDSNGEIKDYNSLITGQGLYDVLSDVEKVEFLNRFLLSETPGNSSDPDKEVIDKRYEEYNKFINQSIPLYISIDSLHLVPNGDNGIATLDYTCKISDIYTLCIYKVYSKVHVTYVGVLKVEESSELVNTSLASIRFVASTAGNQTTNLIRENKVTLNSFGSLFFSNFYRGGIAEDATAKTNLAKKNSLYLEVWYKYNEDRDGTVKVGNFFGENLVDNKGIPTDDNYITFKTSGTYLIYLKDLAGNTRLWSTGSGNVKEYLTITIMPEVIVNVDGDVPVDYNYYSIVENEDGTTDGIKVDVMFASSGYYDNGSVRIYAYYNGSDQEYIASKGGKNNIVSYEFKEYGTYRVIVEATVDGVKISKTIVFSILNPYESRIALDFTQISKYNIIKVENSTTGMDVTSQFNFLINEGFIYSKLITHERLSAQGVFGSTMGKQTFKVYYTVNTDSLVPTRECSFEFTVNNQTPSLQSSIKPGESTTKKITIKFNAQTIFRQVGDCYIEVNGIRLVRIKESDAPDVTKTITLDTAGDYYVKIVSDSGRVMTSFKVTIKEPLNTMSIILIVAAIIVVVGIIVTFVVLRTRMKVR